MKSGVLFLFLAMGVGGAGAQAGAAGAQAAETAIAAPTMERARALAAKGQLDAALAELDALAKQRPEPAGVDRMRGNIFYQRGDFERAVEAYARAEAGDAGDREATEMHGVSLFRMGRTKEAIPLLERARAEVAGANVDPNYVLALCYEDAARFDDARRAFAAQFGFEAESAEAHLAAGRMFLRRELKTQAGAEARRALELKPGLPLAHELLGEVALAEGDLAGAVKELEAERGLNPLSAEVYDRLGDAYVRGGEWAKAREALNRAVLLEPQATGPYILLGEVYVKTGEPVQALHYLDHAVRMDPANYMTHNLLGQAYKATGELDRARQEFATAVSLQHRGEARPVEK